MLALTLNALAFSLSPELDLANVKQLKLELPNTYYSQSNSQEDWLTSLYTSSLAPAKEFEPKTQEQINIK